MCGIVYSKSFVGKPVNRTILRRYLDQRMRGTDGFGFYIPETDRLTHNTREGRILTLLRRNKASEILFHHRLPTSTLNVRNACHPFSTKDFFDHNYVVVHNGIVWNDTELKKKHYDMGITYISEMEDGSFNDSEALAYEIGLVIEGKQEKLDAEGSIAFIATQRDKEGKPTAVFFARNYGSPLKIKHTGLSLTISSEGEGKLVEAHRLFKYDYATGELTERPLTVPSRYSESSGYYGGGGNYYTGMGFGHQSRDPYYEEDDDELAMLAYRTGDNVDKIVRNWDLNQAERSKIKTVKDKLLYDNFEDPHDAVMSAEAQIIQLKEREKLLNNLVQSGIASDEEIDEWASVPDVIYYMQAAMKELEQEAASEVQQGFFRETPPIGESFVISHKSKGSGNGTDDNGRPIRTGRETTTHNSH